MWKVQLQNGFSHGERLLRLHLHKENRSMASSPKYSCCEKYKWKYNSGIEYFTWSCWNCNDCVNHVSMHFRTYYGKKGKELCCWVKVEKILCFFELIFVSWILIINVFFSFWIFRLLFFHINVWNRVLWRIMLDWIIS